jgi:hypothetical protein
LLGAQGSYRQAAEASKVLAARSATDYGPSSVGTMWEIIVREQVAEDRAEPYLVCCGLHISTCCVALVRVSLLERTVASGPRPTPCATVGWLHQR